MSRPTHTAPRSLLLTLIGALVCKWKGGHKWKRVPIKKGGGDQYYHPAHSVCTRCGITRPIKARAKRAQMTALDVMEMDRQEMREEAVITDMARGIANVEGRE